MTGPERHITLLSMGAVVENLIQAAAAAGIPLEPVEPVMGSKPRERTSMPGWWRRRVPRFPMD